MALSNTYLRYYDSEVLRLPVDKRKEYHRISTCISVLMQISGA